MWLVQWLANMLEHSGSVMKFDQNSNGHGWYIYHYMTGGGGAFLVLPTSRSISVHTCQTPVSRSHAQHVLR